MRKTLAATVVAGALTAAAPVSGQEITFWYHFDNPDNPIDELVARFEAENPGITINAQNIPWNTYYDQLTTSIIGGNAPDTAMVKLFAMPQLLELEALVPLDDYIAGWDGAADLLPDLLDLHEAPDGGHYYLPIQYVVLYLYYRTDMFAELGLEPPATCEAFLEAAQALTRDTDGDGQTDVYGFGMRGGRGGHDHWATFVLSRGASFEPGGLVTPEAIAANEWFVALHRDHGVFPPSAPNDGFNEITGNFRAGLTAMTIHHIGSSNSMVESLGDTVSAVPVPQCDGGAWTAFGDESTAIFSQTDHPDAAWRWISFLSTGENNVLFNQATGQLTVTQSGSADWALHEQRFVDATVASLPYAALLPNVPETAEFVGTVWPVNMQRALLGEITPEEMMRNIDAHFHGE